MFQKKKRKAAVLALILICTLLVTELPRIINAEGENVADENKSNSQITAQDVVPVNETDPMYWMGQRAGGDINRAMVWFGEYWQGSDAGRKSPVLWRTLRSDGQGNYGGSVTLLAEHGLNAVYFDQNTVYNQHWCNPDQSIGSSDLRAWMNGVGTGAMDSSADWRSRFTGNNISYNNAGGGAGDTRGSFYANAFNESEKNFIVPTTLAGETGGNNVVGNTVTDKVFALNGIYRCSDNYDAASKTYFKDSEDRKCYVTDFAAEAGNTITKRAAVNNAIGLTYWWLRSPNPNNTNYVGECNTTAIVSEYFTTTDKYCGRPAINFNPSELVFTPAGPDGRAPVIAGSSKGVTGLEAASGAPESFDTDLNGNPVYANGASFRVFSRNGENSNLGIGPGNSEGSIALSYPSGAAGQYISVLVVNDQGEKWTGRIKHIEDGGKGIVEFSIPQRTPGTSNDQEVYVFAWRETEDLRTACIPNYKRLSVSEAASFGITYDGNGGTNGAPSMAVQSVVQGSECVLRPCTFKKNKSYFVGWQDSDGAMYSDKEQIKPEGNMTLTAIWSDTYNTITYKAGNGTGSDIIYNHGTGSKVVLPDSTFTAPGSAKFLEWNTKADGTGTSYQPGDVITLNEDIILFAAFGTKAAITYNGNGAAEDNMTQEGYLEKGFTLKSEGFTKTGYVLSGWNTEPDGSGTAYKLGEMVTTFTGDTTLYAQWQANNFTITFQADDATQGSAPDDISLAYGGSAAIPDAGVYRSHYIFDGWAVNEDGSGDVYYKDDQITADNTFPGDTLTLYARWKDADNYKVTYDFNIPAGVPDSDTAGSMPDDDLTCYNDEINTKTSAASTEAKIRGHVFKGWSASPMTPPNSEELISPGDDVTPAAPMKLFAVWGKANQWTVTYSGTAEGVNGQFPVDEEEYYNDGFAYKAVVKDNTQTRIGYSFLGWSTSKYATEAEYTKNAELPVTGNITLYAVWEINTCTVKYDRNAEDGSGSAPADQSGTFGQKFTVSAAPEDMKNPGHKFMGWNTKSDGSGDSYTAGQSYSFEKDMILYAMWDNEDYILIYDSNADDTTAPAPASVTGNVASDIKAAEQGEMFRPRHKFAGWNTEEDGSGDTIQPGDKVVLNKNKTLYALWQPLTAATVTYFSGCSDSLVEATLPNDTNEYFDDGVSKNTAEISKAKPVRYGYEFSCWSTRPDGGGTRYYGGEKVNMTKDLKLYAVWDIGSYTLTYDANASGVKGKLPPNKYGNILSDIKAEGAAGFSRPYYTFTGWNTETDGSGTAYLPGESVSLGKDTTLYAQWKETVYEVKFDLNSPEISEASGTLPANLHGTHTEKFTAPEPEDFSCRKYKFTGWNTDAYGEGTHFEPGEEYTYGIFEDYGEKVTLFAEWESVPPFVVVYNKNSSDASGEVPVDNKEYVPDDGTDQVTVLGPGSLKRKGYEFVCWTTKKDGSGSKYVAGSRFRITAHTVLYAQWTPGTYTLTYNKNGSDITGKAPTSIRISSQEDIKASGPGTMKRKNYEFLGWGKTPGAAAPAYKAGAKFRILENTTLYAVWKKLISVSIEKTEGLEAITNSVQNVSQGSKLSDIKLPGVKDGYEIQGWIVNGQKVTNPDSYILSKDSEVQAIVKKKPAEDKKDDPDKDDDKNNGSGGDNNTGGNNSGGSSSGNGSQPGTGGQAATGPTTFRAGKVTPGNTGTVYKAQNKKASKTVSGKNADALTAGTGSTSPALASGSGISERTLNKSNAYGPESECSIHWCLLAGIILSALYTLLRGRRIKKKELLKPNFFFDIIIPLFALPLCAAAWVYQYCRIDIYLIAIWLLISMAGIYYLHRCYRGNVVELEEAWKPAVDEYKKHFEV